MSMKRSKEVTRGRAREVDGGFWDKKEPERVYVWDTDVAVKPDDAFVAYAPAQRYAKDVLVIHSKFGRGVVTDVDGGKIDVLFQDGQKKLTHGLAGGPIIMPKVIEIAEGEDEASAAVTVPAPPPVHEPTPVIIPETPAVPEAAAISEATTDPNPDPPAASETEPRHTMDPPTDPDPDPPPTGGSSDVN
jgi:hypothetical protein